jgi:RHS repeat-associated protein
VKRKNIYWQYAEIYYYHSDHLGTGTFLSDFDGNPYQFFLNLPFGETMAEQHSYSGDYTNRYKFNGKELDEETGLYYYGARYYNPKFSIWLSVDPLAEKFPSWNPYNYCMDNPLYYTDPTGMSAEPPVNGLAFFSDDTGNYYWNDAKSSYEHYAYTDDSKTTTVFKDYYTANEFKEPVGDYNIIFDLSNSKPKDVYDPEKTITGIALPTLHYLDLFGNTKDISDNDKYPGVKIYSSPNMNGALTAGNVIIMDSEMVGDGETLDHEYGHYLDYKYHFNYNQGEYIDKIAIPSVKSAAGNGVHEKTSTEKRANRLGGEYGNNKALKDKYRPKK